MMKMTDATWLPQLPKDPVSGSGLSQSLSSMIAIQVSAHPAEVQICVEMVNHVNTFVNTVEKKHLKEQRDGVAKGLEVVHIIKARPDLDSSKEGHAKDREDEHDQEQKESNVDQGRKGHDQREEECSDASGSFDQPQYPTNLGHSNLSIERMTLTK